MAAEEEGEEVVYAPEMIPESDGELYCFLDHGRPCSAECMSFMTHMAALKKTELNDNQRHCVLLVNADRLARHAVILVSLLAETEKKKRTAEQDRTRSQNTPTPGPFAAPIPASPFPVEKP